MFLVYRWLVQGASSSFPPRREQGLEGTRSLLSSRLQREHEGADPIPARPPACLWLGHRESSFYCGRLRPITRKRPPVAGGAPLLCFPIPFARDSAMRSRVWISDRRRGHATPLVVAHGARGCGDTLRTASSPCSTEGLLLRTFPRRTARTASPRCPPSSRRASMRARPARDSDPLARGRGRRTG